MTFAIQVRTSDLERLQKLLEVAKAVDLWRESFGKCAFTVNIPDFDTDLPVRDRYIQMVQVHGSVQLSLGVAGIPGVTQLDKPFTIKFDPDEDGNRKPSTRKALCQVLLQMKYNGKMLFGV